MIITLFVTAHLFAQEESRLQKFDQVEALLNSRPDSAIKFVEKILETFTVNDSLQSRANYYLGMGYYYKGLYYTSGEHFKDALDSEYAQKNKIFKSECHSRLGSIYDLTDQYDQALENHLSSMEIDRELDDYAGVNQARIKIGLLYNNIGQFEKARNYLMNAKDFFTTTGNKSSEALALQYLSVVAKNMGDIDDAKKNLRKTLDLYKTAGNTFDYVDALIQKASLEILEKKFNSASLIIDDAFNIAKNNNYSYLKAKCQLSRARLMIGKGQFYIAYEYLREIETFNSRIAKEKYILMILAASKTHSFKNFKDELSDYNNFRDSLEEKNTNMIVNELHIKYDTKNRIRKIQEQEEELVTNRRRLITALIIILILTVLLVIIITYHRKLQKSYREIFLKEKQVQSEFVRTISTKTYRENPTENDESTEKNNHADPQLWECIIDLMKNKEYYLDPNLSLNEIVKACNSNRSYVSKTIKAFSSQNFCNFVNRFRIEKAKSILQNYPDYAQESVAKLSGFKSTATFYRIFKSYTGLTPNKYNTLARKN